MKSELLKYIMGIVQNTWVVPGVCLEYLYTTGSLQDTSGNNNTANVRNGTLSLNRHSVTDNAYSFVGTNGGGVITTGNVDMTSTNQISISMWVKLSDTSSRAFFQNNVGTPTNGIYLLRDTSNRIQCIDYVAGAIAINTSIAFALTTSVWHHLVVTCDRNLTTNSLNIYVDNSLKRQASRTVVAGNFASGFMSFGSQLVGNFTILGALDDCRVFPFILTSEQITALFNE